MTLVIALAVLVVAAAAAPLLTRLLGRNAGYVLAAAYAVAAVAIGGLAPRVLDGEAVRFSAPWMSALGVRFTLVVDGLSLLFALLVLGIGVLITAYAARYFKPEQRPGRLLGLLTLFAASMVGLVLAGDLVLLFVCWELTSITSYFLIGGEGREGSVKGARRALLVTGLGGMVLFAGLLLLGVVAGTFDLATILADADAVRAHPLAGAVLALVLVGAFTKSAQFPFHFWLPGAMVAPTPVSAYLHAATMVKAGIYLLARLAPVFSEEPAWTYAVTLTGLVTAVLGAAFALQQYDLKALLAYSTISQLGFIVALLGVGTPHAFTAAMLHTIAHAAYKATLFMVVGVLDVEAGSRDIRKLSGLRNVMPITATITALAAVSMAGLPPLVGFVSKEEAFTAFLASPGAPWLAPAAAVLAVSATAITFAYGARILFGAFGGKLVQEDLYEPSRAFTAPAALTAVAGVLLGIGVGRLDGFVEAASRSASRTAEVVHLELWHGVSPALGLSVLTMVGGLGLFAARGAIDGFNDRHRMAVTGWRAFDALHDGVAAVGRVAARPFVATAPLRTLAWVLGTVTAAGAAAWLAYGRTPLAPPPPGRLVDWAMIAALVMSVTAAATLRTRLGAVAVVGIGGFSVSLLYVLLGAPDLALTQLLVETLTVLLVVLVFRRLPQLFHAVSAARKAAAAGAALVVGAATFAATYALTGRRGLSDVGRHYLDVALEEAGGHNVVNTILVDFRALDTLGEITVLVVAALGIFILVRQGRSAP